MNLNPINLALRQYYGGFVPELNLRFTEGFLDPRINFSRTSNATVTNSLGTIAYAPHNLLTYSEQFDNAVWVKRGTATIIANAIAAPNGTTTADLLSNLGSIGVDDMYYSVSAGGSIASTITLSPSIYIKKVSASGTLILQNSSGAGFGSWSINLALLSSDWERVTSTHIAVTVTTPYTGTNSSANGFQLGTSSGTLSFYIWGAQLEIGSTATTYNSTTVKNLLGYSELFDNAAWTKSNSFVQTNLLTYSEDFSNAAWAKANGTSTNPVVTANAVIAPNGYQTADTITFGVIDAAGDFSVITQVITLPTTANYTRSIYVKATTAGDVGKNLYFYVTDGGLKDVVTITLTADWQRITKTLAMASGTGKSFTIGTLGSAIGGANQAAVSADIWGFQVVQGDVAGDYRRTDAAASPIYYANHNGVVCAEQIQASAGNGTFLESYTSTGGSQTFSIWLRRVTGTGNVDLTMDSGATYTTQTISSTWARYSVTSSPTAGAKTAGVRIVTSGDVIQAFGAMVGDSASLDAYSLNIAAAPSAAAYYGPRFDYDPVTLQPKGLLIEEQRQNLLLNATIAGANLATQSVTVTAVAHTLSFYGTGQIVLSGTASATVTGTGAYPTRTTLTFTPTAGSLTLTVTGTVQYAQLEIGSFATSFIPTAGSQVTRTADVATIVGSNFYSWFGTNEASVTATFDSPASGNRNALSIDDNTANNYLQLRTETADPFFRQKWTGTEQVALDLGTITANTMNKAGYGFKVNDYAAVINGGTVGTDTSASTIIADRMRIGTSQAGEYLNGHVKSVSCYSTRLSDATLKGLTA